MRRRVLTPRWLAVHAAVAAVVVTFVGLGFWQLDRARAEAEPKGAETDPAPVALTTVTTPGEQLTADAVGRLVTVAGRYDPGQQFLLHRETTRWVVSVLRTPDGAGIPVVRGSTDAESVPPPSAEVSVSGWLQPSEIGTMSDGAINSAELIQHVPYELYDGYLVLSEERPPPTDDLEPVQPPRTSGDDPGFPLQNAAYTLQWWLFAGFAVFIWWRTVRDAARGEDEPVAAAQRPAQKRAAHG